VYSSLSSTLLLRKKSIRLIPREETETVKALLTLSTELFRYLLEVTPTTIIISATKSMP
jgi:hypothetical protein